MNYKLILLFFIAIFATIKADCMEPEFLSEHIYVKWTINTEIPLTVSNSNLEHGKCFYNNKRLETLNGIKIFPENTTEITCKGRHFTPYGPKGDFDLITDEKKKITNLAFNLRNAIKPEGVTISNYIETPYSCEGDIEIPISFIRMLTIKCGKKHV